MKDTPIPHTALIMVGDGKKALFFRNEGTPLHVSLVVERVLQQENPPTREQGTSAPGRFRGGDGSSRSAVEETDWHQLAEDRFAHEISTALYRLAQADNYQQLVVIAPPKILGVLRESFHHEVAKRVVAEFPKDLTGRPKEEIARMLSG
jgi:protein required for attachment to host cells